MKKSNPTRKIGIVTFSNDVVIIGDASDSPEIIAGDKLNKYNDI